MENVRKNIASLAVFIIALQIVGSGLGWLTSNDIDSWYQGLVKSPLNPPGYAFGIAWTILYVMLSVCVWLVWIKPASAARKNILILFAAHMVLNWAWTPVFFTANLVAPAFFLILVLIASALVLIRMILPLDRRAAILLIPYIGWLSFAAHLNFYIWQHNP